MEGPESGARTGPAILEASASSLTADYPMEDADSGAQDSVPSCPQESTSTTPILGGSIQGKVVSRTLLFSMDYGSKKVAMAYRDALPDEGPTAFNVHVIPLSDETHHAPQIAAFSDNGTFYWGQYAQQALQNQEIEHEHIIELWKLLLYKDHKSSKIVREVQIQLGERAIDDFLTIHIAAVFKEAIDRLKSTPTSGLSAEDVENLPKKLFLSVPQLWKPPANRISKLDAAAFCRWN